MRFESARRKIAKLLYQRFVASENEFDVVFDKGSSVFQIVQQRRTGSQAQASTTALPLLEEKSKSMAAHHPTNKNNNIVMAHQHETLGIAQPTTMQAELESTTSMLQIGTSNNPVGVYGSVVKRVQEKVNAGLAPKDLFDEVSRDVMNDLKLDVYPRFKDSEFYKKYIRTKWIDTQSVTVKDFTTFRVLGRGGFGAVHACRKKNCGTIYAMKCINKKLVKVKSALDNVLEERNVLTMMKSNFVTNLKYALQDEENLYLIMDLMLGGDLKFHLINAGRFTEKRARFYAAEVLLGLEHVHNASIIYRDMKLENVLLDHNGHCRLSDLGLAVVTKVRIKGYAGTPGYTAPEMIKNKLYGRGADIFSFGVMLYRMLCGSKPFKGKIDRDLDKAVIERKPQFPKEIFSKEAISLLSGLLQKRPENRLGCGAKGIEEIKEHPFFECIDWGLLEAGYIDPPFVPNKFDVNAASLKDIGDFDRAKYRHVKLDDRFKEKIKNFEFISMRALHDEMVSVLEKADENMNFEKFAAQPENVAAVAVGPSPNCCTVL
jgi:serine/threonine protein kinase